MSIKRTVSVILSFIFLSLPVFSTAHTGRTDSNGGHKDNKNKSGLGSYHYHCGGKSAHSHANGICPHDPKDSIKVDKMPSSMHIGTSEKLSWVVTSYSGNGNVEWTTSNESIAYVDEQTGHLFAKGVGTCKITANMRNGSKTWSIKVNPVKIESITISSAETTISIGDNVNLNTVIEPKNATNKSLTWTSSNKKVAIVDDKGTVTAIENGKAKITAKTNDKSNKSVSITINVATPISSIALHGVTIIDAGEKTTFIATITPENAANKKLKWEVSDNKLASISSKGVVTIKKTTTDTNITIIAYATDNSGVVATHNLSVR